MRLVAPRTADLGVDQPHTAYRTPVKLYLQELVRLSEGNGAFRPDREDNSSTKNGARWPPKSRVT